MDKKELFKDIEEHLLKDERPSTYLNKLKNEGVLDQEPFNIIGDLQNIPQEKKFHPEGNVWNHVMMVVDEAAKRRSLSEDAKSFMWASLLHDVGKGPTTVKRNGRWTSYNHDSVGADMARKFLSEFSGEQNFSEKVAELVRWHMQSLYVTKKLPFAQISRMAESSSVQEIGLLSLCDKLARGEMNEGKTKEVYEKINLFLDKVSLSTKHKYNHYSYKN